jgi:adenylyltransferase/sulfurtransferase
MYNGQQIKSYGNISFDKKELARYNRHLIIPEFGMEGQQKLKSAKVLVVGTGGLGSPLLQYLAAAGVGTIGILDFDTVEESNLHRQVLFGISDVGKPKVEAAKHKLSEINPHINIHVHNVRLTSENAFDIIKNYDVVADGTDNFPTRYLVNDACIFLDKPNIYASIFQFEGQVSVFNYVDSNGERGPNYRDLFPTPPPPGLVPSCAEAGVLGVLPGIIGSVQANEVIKVITDVGDPLAGRLFLFDALSFITRTVNVKKRPDNPLTGDNPTQTELIDYQEFCGVPDEGEANNDINEITVQEFKDKLDSDENIQIIDVREPYEYEISNLGGELIPLNTILERHDKISRDKPVIVHCKAGVRSARAIRQLNENYGFDNLYNLKGGIIEYAKQVDETVPQY